MAKIKNVDEFGRPMLRIGEAAEYLGVGSATIRAYSEEGRLAFTRSCESKNGQRLYKIADLERFGRENHIRRRKATITAVDFDSMSDEDTVGINQASKYLNISAMTIRNYVRRGDLACTREGGRNAMMFSKGDLDAFAASHTDIRRRTRRRPNSPENFDFSFDTGNMTSVFMLVRDKKRADAAIGAALSAGYTDSARYLEMTEVTISADGVKSHKPVYRIELDIQIPSAKDAIALITQYLDTSCDTIVHKHDFAPVTESDSDEE